MQAVSISLSVFRTRSPVKIFWSKNRFSSAFAARLRGVKDLLRKSYYPHTHNLIVHRILTNSATGSANSLDPLCHLLYST